MLRAAILLHFFFEIDQGVLEVPTFDRFRSTANLVVLMDVISLRLILPAVKVGSDSLVLDMSH